MPRRHGDATTRLRDGEIVTVDAAAGTRGRTVAPAAAAPVPDGDRPARPVTGTQLLVNLSEPSQVERAAALDVEGVGLLRAELMVLEALEGVHPGCCSTGPRRRVRRAHGGRLTAFAGASPRGPITYRTIDFRTNEFRGLEGGDRFEPEEANPMIGFRGACSATSGSPRCSASSSTPSRVWDAGH